METWDLLDENGEKTGGTVTRGEDLRPGEYYLAVHIWIVNDKGEYLIQKRTEDKALWPGKWAATGGAVISGETSLQAAAREVEEELSIRADPSELLFLSRLKRKGWFTDLWLLRRDVELEAIVMQPEEVSDVLWATAAELRDMVARKDFVAYDYLDAFLDGSYSQLK